MTELVSKPISDYASRLGELISQYEDSSKSAHIHHEKFAAVRRFLGHIRLAFASRSTTIITTLFSQTLEAFESALSVLTTLAASCQIATYSKLLAEESVSVTFNKFLHFWYVSARVLRLLSPFLTLDLAALSVASDRDLLSLKDVVNPTAAAEIASLIAAGALDPAQYQMRSFLAETPYSCFFECQTAVIEIMDPGAVDAARFRKYSDLLQGVPQSSFILNFKLARSAPPFVVQYEAAPGGSFERRLQLRELSPTQLSFLLFRIARGIEFLHTKEIVHRFLNPYLIFLTERNEPKIAGLFYSNPPKRPGPAVPFSGYSAPELIADPTISSYAIDVYSWSLILWHILTREDPFQNLSVEDMKTTRLHVPYEFAQPHFFTRCWDGKPEQRPAFSDIARAIQDRQVTVPGTDSLEFDLEFGRGQGSPRSVVLPVNRPTPVDNLLRKQDAGNLTETDIMKICQAAEGNDFETKARAANGLRYELKRTEPFPPRVVSLFIRLALSFPDVVPLIRPLVQQLANRANFSRDVFTLCPPEPAVRLFVKFGIDNDELVKTLLAFGARQTEAIANLLVDLFIDAKANMNYLFDTAHDSAVYSLRALDLLTELSDEDLIINSETICRFATAVVAEERPLFKSIIDRVPVRVTAQFDGNCVAAARLVEWGYDDSVLRFAKMVPYCRRLIVTLFPVFRGRNPTFILKLIIQAAKLPPLQSLLARINLPRIIEVVAAAGDYDVAASAASGIEIPQEMLDANSGVCKTLERLLKEAPAAAAQSAVCLCLLPFAFHSNYVPGDEVIGLVTALLQSDDPTDIARALVFAVVIAQNTQIAQKLADPLNLEAACRFLRSEAPAHFLYVAVRFFLSIAPFLILSEETLPVIEDAVTNILELALRSQDNAKIMLVITQTLVLLPKAEGWIQMLDRCEIQKFVSFATLNYAADANIMAALRLLLGRGVH
jgi:serine/threonine protein kinase